jgi:hypothetical protein
MTNERYTEIKNRHEEAYAADTKAANLPEGFEWMGIDQTPNVDSVKRELGSEWDEYMAIRCPEFWPLQA